jgi:Kef-type K+ transport system membrane component KefB
MYIFIPLFFIKIGIKFQRVSLDYMNYFKREI